MTPEQFRQAGHELIDWIADHRAAVSDRPVRAQVEPGDVMKGFSTSPPDAPVSFDELFAQFEDVVVPGVTEVQHPMHFGWFPSNASLSSVLGDIASSGLGSLGISGESSPALTEVEQVVTDWFRQLLGLSDRWTGTIHDTASTACFTALLVARERASGLSHNSSGLQALPRPLTVYTTAEAHSSVAKAALLAGIGWDNLRSIDTDPVSRAMDANALEAAMIEDIGAGRLPAAVIAGVGTTGTTAFDPVDKMADVIDRVAPDCPARPWLHVDAAMAGTAMLLPECRHLWHGVERADSVSWNPHKWMGTILDCSLLYVRDVAEFQQVLSTNPSFLRSSADGEVMQYRDMGIPLGRRFRSLKLWFHLALDGVESIQDRIRRDLANAQWLADQVAEADGWEVVAPVNLQTVCVLHTPMEGPNVPLIGEALDRHTRGWVERINRSGTAFLTPTIVDGRWIVRVSIGVIGTERSHVAELWTLMQREVEKPLEIS